MATNLQRRVLSVAWLSGVLLVGVHRLAAGQPPASEDDVGAQFAEAVLRSANPEEAVRAGLDLARKCQAKNDPGRAEAILRELVNRYPKCRPAEVMFELGYLLFKDLPRRPEAVCWFRRAVAEGREDAANAARAQLFIGYVYGEQFDLDQAGVEFAALKKQFPNERRRLAQAAVDYVCLKHWQSQDPEGLLLEAQQARQEFADQSDLVGVLDLVSGRLAARMGRFDQALAFLQRVPPDLNFPFVKGVDAAREVVRCYLQMGEVQKAQAALRSLLQRFPGAVSTGEIEALQDTASALSANEPKALLKVVVRETKSKKPVPYARVTVSGQERHFTCVRYTNSEGNVTLGPFPPGRASISIFAAGFVRDRRVPSAFAPRAEFPPVLTPGHVHSFTQPLGLVSLVAGPEPAIVEVDMRPDDSRVRDRTLRLLNLDGKPAREVDAQAYSEGGEVAVRRCDREGVLRFRYSSGSMNRFLNLFRLPDVGVALVDVSTVADGTAVRLTPGVSLGGRVEASPAKGGAFGITVTAQIGMVTFYTVTNFDGQFSLRSLPPGNYLIAVQPPKTLKGRTTTQRLTLKEGQTATNVLLHLEPG